MLASRSRLTAAVCLAVAAMVGRAYGAALSVTSATVSQPGDSAQVCVVLSGGNNQIAGTQNELVWDGTCATLSSPNNCSVAGGHGKQLAADFPRNGGDFTVRAIILSFNDVDPLPDGPLYCCQLTIEASPGQCCPITVQAALGSSSDGQTATHLGGNQGQLCTRSDQSGRSGGLMGGPSANQPLSASNAPIDAGANNPPPPANQPPPASGPARAPAAQVLQGGGGAPGNVVADAGNAAGVPPTSAIGAPPVPPAVPAVAAPTPARPILAPPTALANAAPTLAGAAPTVRTAAATAAAAAVRTIAGVGTPTHGAALPTHVATRRAGANAQQVAPPEAEKSGGWFGCQIAAGATAVPVLGLGAIAALAVVLRRRRAGRR